MNHLASSLVISTASPLFSDRSQRWRSASALAASREAAVVKLADSVEAATRSLKKPTLARLEQAIHDLIMDKFAQGQLARTNLTFRDLETIMNTFTRILAGHFHTRIEYPKARESAR